ncbi:MAG: GtrA family protein [Candidatus Saccharimonas sp.]|nr:MAG: GtrA family protein [Candidatus Saccharimonas sp.]
MANNRGKLLRFALVGGINTAIDIGLLFGLTALGVPKLAANTVSTGLAFIFSFFANKSYTFRAQGNMRRQLILFVIVTLAGLWGLQNAVIFCISPILTSVIHTKPLVLLVAKIIATGASLVWNYCLYDRVVFWTTEK